MKTTRWLITLALAASAMHVAAGPQHQADVKIKAVQKYDTPWGWYCRATIHNAWDDDAHDARVILQVPVGVNVNGISATSTDPAVSSANCTAVANGSTDAHVMCKLGSMQVQETVTLLVRTTPPPAGVTRRECAAFAWSNVPDPNRENNHAVSP